MVAALEEEHLVVAADDPRIDAPLVFALELLGGKIGGDYGRETSVLPCVDEVVDTGHGELVHELCAEIVKYKQVALEIFLGLTFVLTVARAKSVILECGDDILCRVVKHVEAARDDLSCDSGGDMRFARAGGADEEQIAAPLAEAVGKFARKRSRHNIIAKQTLPLRSYP